MHVLLFLLLIALYLDFFRAGVKGVMILTPILGINWLFGLLAVNEDMIVFEFLFVIINSLQGFLIFLFHCVGSSEVRQPLLSKYLENCYFRKACTSPIIL